MLAAELLIEMMNGGAGRSLRLDPELFRRDIVICVNLYLNEKKAMQLLYQCMVFRSGLTLQY
ncbi:hypothetical protein MKX70_23850 [Paenibacillus sp. FSL R7-0312]|uniref:hypothetical protein n=1 Tax=unclassified Paenibacillus TaxID=185978 RepID=UPI0004F91EF6|nr:hypothetical protein [Paenibacillus sp. FSL R5-0912]AIQ41292.1 hypothetical protein R50912_15575 [Paenibacillus sp. FSL R5-0912]